MNKEALKLALEALTYIYTETTADEDELIDQAITAIKEALSEPEPEPEPVAWMFQHDETGRMTYVSNDGIHDPTMFLGMNPRYALVCPLYTTPPQRAWVGLSKEEKRQFVVGYFSLDCDRRIAIALMDDYEAYLKEKNT